MYTLSAIPIEYYIGCIKSLATVEYLKSKAFLRKIFQIKVCMI